MGEDSTMAQRLDASFLEEMTVLKRARSKRVSSWDRTGANFDAVTVPGGDTFTLADIKSAGCIRHVYFTTNHMDSFYMRTVILRMYWDDEKTPSVEVPLGDLFGLGFCQPRYFGSLLVTVCPGGVGTGPNGALIGLNLYFPMPFSKRALITLENDSDGVFSACWYHIDYEEWDSAPDDSARFHAQWRRENPTTPTDPPNEFNLTGKDNYVILEAEGWGNYVGMFLNVDNICGGWYGEGDDMIFIDGDTWPPSLHGTGSEEVFGGGACPATEYATPYTGYHLISSKDYAGKQSMYRFHVADPVRFEKRIRVTIEHGTGNDLGNDYSSTAFWYQREPHAAFPSLPPRMERIPRCDEGLRQIYEKEMQAVSVVSELLRRFKSARDFVEAVPKEEWGRVGQLGATLKTQTEAKDYEAALKTVAELSDAYQALRKKMEQSLREP